MKNAHKILFITLGLLFVFSHQAIEAVSSSKNRTHSTAERKGDLAHQNGEFAIAAEYFEHSLTGKSATEPEILAKLADCYWQMRLSDKALKTYQLLYPSYTTSIPEADCKRIAELYARTGDYQKAALWMGKIPRFKAKADCFAQQDSILKMKSDSTQWSLRYSSINSRYREFSPCISNNRLFFSSNKPGTSPSLAYGLDGKNLSHLWEINLDSISGYNPDSVAIDSTLSPRFTPDRIKKLADIYEGADTKTPKTTLRFQKDYAILSGNKQAVGKILNGLDLVFYNAGPVAVDLQHHFYFSSNYLTEAKDGVNRIRIMEGVLTPDGVQNISPLPFGNPELYSVMHPAVNNEGTVLICSSDKPNGTGGFDLYYSMRENITQRWDSLKIIKGINTSGNEVFPTITSNNFLYFSSDALPGLGGLDIYRIPVNDAIEGKTNYEHLSYPINSSADDFGWAQLDSIGYKGYFTSDRFNNDDNLYSCQFTPRVIIPKKSYIEGYIIEKATKKPIEGATAFMYSVAEDTVYIAKTDENGKYKLPVVESGSVIIKALDKRFNQDDCLNTDIVYESQPKDTIQHAPRSLELDIYKVGYVWRLSNIHYDFNKWDIRADAAPILDSLVTLLKVQPITVELGSHTDARGSFKFNEKLSQRRAESAVAYLVQHGIKAKRIRAKGYGESQLLNKCADGVDCTEEEHQVNRRTEVKVTGYTIPQKKKNMIDTDKFKAGQKINRKDLPKGFFDGCK